MGVQEGDMMKKMIMEIEANKDIASQSPDQQPTATPPLTPNFSSAQPAAI